MSFGVFLFAKGPVKSTVDKKALPGVPKAFLCWNTYDVSLGI
jgi:hypothetical protein